MEIEQNTTPVLNESLSFDSAIFRKEEMNPQVEQVKALLRQLKVESYEENVIPFLIEFMDQLKRKGLEEAKTYAECTGSDKINEKHIQVAFSLMIRKYLSTSKPKSKDTVPDTRVKIDGDGVVLPNPANLMETVDPVIQMNTRKL